MKIDKRTFKKILELATEEALFTNADSIVCSICNRETLCKTKRITYLKDVKHTKQCVIGKGFKLLEATNDSPNN